MLAACKEAVEYNKGMEALKGGEGIPSGVGAVSLTGTDWEAVEGRNKDLREVFRYVVLGSGTGLEPAVARARRSPVDCRSTPNTDCLLCRGDDKLFLLPSS